MSANSPLNSTSIVVTRPSRQNKFMCAQLAELGARPIAFPCIEISPVNDIKLSQLNSPLDWVIFISTNAAQFGFPIYSKLDSYITANCQLAAVGASTAQALHEFGIHKVLIPNATPDSEGLLKLPELQDVDNQSILIIKGVGGRELLYEALKNRGANINSIDVYQRSLPKSANLESLSGEIDLLLFTSNESVNNFLALTPESLQKSLLGCQTVVGHARIAEKVTSLGFKNLPIIATTPSDTDMLAAINQWALNTRLH